MRRLLPPMLALVLLGMPQALGGAPARLPTFADIQAWAGPDAAALGFTEDKLEAFMRARRTDPSAARQPEWSTWLKALEPSKSPSLRAWALTRRVEAGDYSCYPALQEAAVEHLLGLSKPGSGRGNQVIVTNPIGLDARLPGPLQIDHRSPFWPSLRKTLLETPERTVSTGLYAIWCYGTHPDQRDLILELASFVKNPRTIRNPQADPWNDARFWIILDWVMAWGTTEDFEAVGKALPEGPARSEFSRIFQSLLPLRGFFATGVAPLPLNLRNLTQPGDSAPDGALALDPAQEHLREIPFQSIKVVEQPPAPSYPLEARVRKMMTILVLKMVVDAEGRPSFARPLPGPWLGFFAPNGVAYSLRWRFRAAEVDHVPTAGYFKLTLPYRLRF